MSAQIKDYNLVISDRSESCIKRPLVEYSAFADGWTLTESDIRELAERIRWLLEKGYRPIATIFVEK